MTDPVQDPATRPSARREELLAATVAYVARNNLSDLSLRPLAAAIGTSPRVLLYLFGSKEGLVRAVLGVGRDRQLALLESSGGRAGTPREALELLWGWLTDPEHRGALRLFFEGYVRAFDRSGPWQDLATASLAEWLPPLERVLAGQRVDATTVLAVLRGLLLDLLATDPDGTGGSGGPDDSDGPGQAREAREAGRAAAERVEQAWAGFLDLAFGPAPPAPHAGPAVGRDRANMPVREDS